MAYAEWRRHFPVGPYLGTVGELDVRERGSGTSTVRRSYAVNAHLNEVLQHPEQGIKANGFRYAFPHPGNLTSWEATNATTAAYAADTTGGPLWLGMSGAGNRSGAGLNEDWYTRNGVNQTDADADVIAQGILDLIGDHDSILFWSLGDDITVGSTASGAEFVTIARAMQRLDPIGRPAMGVVTDPNVWALYTDPSELQLAIFYRYPCGRDQSLNDLPEGDFHREAFADEAGMPADADWVDVIRRRTSALPAHTWFHMILQAHKTGDGGLHYPTARELRKQFWIAVGEGTKGIWWFNWDGYDDPGANSNGYGLGNVTELARMQVAAELNERLTPEIRSRLLRCSRDATDPFEVTGGATTGYAIDYDRAYVSTLYDAGRDLYYCVACNHWTADAEVTISSATLTGKLVNLETGAEVYLPATVTLPALDGTIWVYDPCYGVPMVDPDLGTDVETWWATHWVNPDNETGNHIPQNAIKTHPRVIDVANGADLTAIIAAAPDFTTFRLAANGVYEGTIDIVGKQGIHIISADPNNRATVRRVNIWGHAFAKNYDGKDTDGPSVSFNVVVGTPASPNHDEALDAWEHPKRDFILQNLNFVSDGELILYAWYYIGDGLTRNGCLDWKHDHIAENIPIWIRAIRDMLVEGCTFDGYDTALDQACPSTTGGVPTTPTTVGGPTIFHAGFISGNSGLTNIVFRNNDCDATAAGADGWPWGFFLDGARGCVCWDNDFSGKFTQGLALFLTNDDWTQNFRRDNDGGVGLRLDHESRNARFNVVGRNRTPDADGQSCRINITGFSNLVAENVVRKTGGVAPPLVALFYRTSRQSTKGHRYHHINNVVRDNTAPNGCDFVRFVEYENAPSTVTRQVPPDLLGWTTITGNVVAGDVTAWYEDRPAVPALHPNDGGNVATNNTDSGGARDGV